MICARCQGEVIQRFVGATPILVHVNRSIDHPVIVRKVAPLTESEKRALAGDR